MRANNILNVSKQLSINVMSTSRQVRRRGERLEGQRGQGEIEQRIRVEGCQHRHWINKGIVDSVTLFTRGPCQEIKGTNTNNVIRKICYLQVWAMLFTLTTWLGLFLIVTMGDASWVTNSSGKRGVWITHYEVGVNIMKWGVNLHNKIMHYIAATQSIIQLPIYEIGGPFCESIVKVCSLHEFGYL